MKQHSVGTTMPALNQEIITRIPISLHPIAEQGEIVKVLSALDEKIELNRRMNATLEAMARALFKSWFVDFAPVHGTLDGKRRGGADAPNSGLCSEELQSSPMGLIPQGWKTAEFPEAIDFLEGPGLRNWQYRSQGMRFLNIRCIVDGELETEKANSIDMKEFNETYRHFSLSEGDIVISSSGTLGRLAIVRSDHLPLMINTSIIRMRGRGSVGLAYTWGFLQSEFFRNEMFALASGSVQLNFGPMHLRQIPILLPPDDVLHNFERVAQPLLRLSLKKREESRGLAALRDTLLPKLLSGELSVRKAKEIAHA